MRNNILCLLLIIAGLFTVHPAGAVYTYGFPEDDFTALIPAPAEIVRTDGYFIPGPSTTVVVADNQTDPGLAVWLGSVLKKSFGYGWHPGSIGGGENIIISSNSSQQLPPEGYILDIRPDMIEISAGDRAGVFYGIQTLLQLFPAGIYKGEQLTGSVQIPCMRITDWPEFPYRGIMLDVARTFSDKETVLKFIDNMAAHKLNSFHWHLADDEGWRIELDSYPRLAQIGGFRGGDSPVHAVYGKWTEKYGGYFTKEDIREIVAYATFRNVEIIPEIDLPGHSRTAANVHPEILCNYTPNLTSTAGYDRRNVWCASKESNYRMLEAILAEIMELFPSEYINIGGDEVELGQWKSCPDCQKTVKENRYPGYEYLTYHFIGRLNKFLKQHGRKSAVWNEAVKHGTLDKTAHVHGWENIQACLDATSKGYKTIVMPGNYFYIDMRQAPGEDGQVWAGVVEARRIYSFDLAKAGFKENNIKNVLGMEAAFFTELYLSHDYEYLDFMTYPRACALSELNWSGSRRGDWDDFYNRLTGKHLDRLAAKGVMYRVEPPVTEYRDGILTVTPAYPDTEIRYTDDGQEPGPDSQLYAGPIATDDPKWYNFKSYHNGRNSASKPVTITTVAKIPAGSTRTVSLDLNGVIRTPGLWYLRVIPSEPGIRMSDIGVTAGGTKTNIYAGDQRVNEMHTMKFRATEANRNGVLSLSVKNPNSYTCDVVVELLPSPYMEAGVTATSSITESSRFPYSRVADYDFSSYARSARTCREGDTFTYTFSQPVSASSIEVRTGLWYMPRYVIPRGRVEVSADGKNFTFASDIWEAKALLLPEGEIKAIRIVAEQDGNSENAVSFQDLRIKPLKK